MSSWVNQGRGVRTVTTLTGSGKTWECWAFRPSHPFLLVPIQGMEALYSLATASATSCRGGEECFCACGSDPLYVLAQEPLSGWLWMPETVHSTARGGDD